MKPLQMRTLVLLGLAVLAARSEPAYAPEGKLTVRVLTFSGSPLPPGSLSIRSKDGAFVSSVRVQDEAIVRLPYGDYVITFDTDLYRAVPKTVTVDRPESFAVVSAIFEGAHSDMEKPFAISIKVRPADSCFAGSYLWAKLVSVFSDRTAEVRVGTAGYALFDPVEFGSYVVIIVDGQKIRAVQPVSTSAAVTRLDISLSACNWGNPGNPGNP